MAYRVLIVDDSAAMRAFVRRVMEISGFDLAGCLEASNGTQERADRMLKLGASGYVRKPFRPEALRTELERSLKAFHE